MSLRTRLLAGMFFLVSVALVVAAASIYTEQRSFLYNHLDQRVIAAATPISYQLGVDARRLKRPAGKGKVASERTAVSPLGKGLAGFLPSGTYGALVDPEGRILRGPVTVSNGEERVPGSGVSRHDPGLATRPQSHPVHDQLQARIEPALPRRGAAAAVRRRVRGRRDPTARGR